VSSAQYRLVAAGGGQGEAGSGDVTVADGILELSPAGGTPLRIPASRIASIAEPEPFTILVTLADGTALELGRLGRMRTQLLEELRDARAKVAAAESGMVGEAARFTGTVGADPADLHVFEDALLVIAGGRVRRIAFSFVTDVRAQDYTVAVSLAGGAQVALTRLGRRTDEFVTLLGERLTASRGRTAAFLGSLLPGLDPMALRAAAGLLRDGLAAPAAALDAIHQDLSGTLLRVAALPDRYAAISGLAGSGLAGSGLAGTAALAIGFKQVASVRRAAAGATPWHDPSVTPHIGQHDSQEGMFPPGLGGAMAAGMMSGMGGGLGGYGLGGLGGPGGYGLGGYGYGGPFGGGPGYGGMGGYWAFRALGGGMNWNSGVAQHQMTPRADVRRGMLTPETEDLSALTTRGDNPTVLAFALLSVPDGAVAYEVLNLPDPLTYVYRGPGGEASVSVVNQALDDAGFAAAELHAAASGDLTAAHRQDAAASPLARALMGTVPHDDAWAAKLAGLLRN
jgi:hypothetical protein